MTTGINTDTILQTIKIEMKNVMTREADRVYTERPQVKPQTQLEKNFVKMLQLRNSNGGNEIKAASVGLLKTVKAKLSIQEAADDLIAEYLDCCMKSDKFVNDFVIRILTFGTFMRPVPELIKGHVDLFFHEWCHSQIYAVSENEEKAGN